MNIPKPVIIPKDLNECFQTLQDMLYPEELTEFISGSEEDTIAYHMGVGMWMRNNWGLWQGSELQKYFIGLGLHHADDMSGVIIKSFYRFMNGKPLKVDEQIKYYQDFWAKTKP